jgi:hypothetical protein
VAQYPKISIDQNPFLLFRNKSKLDQFFQRALKCFGTPIDR